MIFAMKSVLEVVLIGSALVAFNSSYGSGGVVVVDAADEADTTCACAAIRHGFDIDCSDQDAMLAAVGGMEKNKCSDIDCNSNDECVKNFLIIQSHHDFCFHEEVPETVERVIHLYEDGCTQHCAINPKHDVDQRKCPGVDCAVDSGGADEAFQTLINEGESCFNDCGTTNCANSFRLLKTVHDKCPKDTLSWAMEVAYHDYDEICNDYGCNLPEAGEPADELICEDLASVMSSAPRTVTGSSCSLLIAAVLFVSVLSTARN